MGPRRKFAPAGLRLRVLAGSRGESSLLIHVLHGAIDPVVPGNPRHVPLHHLRDGVLVAAIKLLQLRDGDLHEIAIHGSL